MQEYREVRKHHSLVEICKKPELAAEVTITAAEILKVDAAIIFADLLLPLEVMGMPFHFAAGEGPVIEKPVRESADVGALQTNRASELNYVSDAIRQVVNHFGQRLPVIGFCGAPFTLYFTKEIFFLVIILLFYLFFLFPTWLRHDRTVEIHFNKNYRMIQFKRSVEIYFIFRLSEK